MIAGSKAEVATGPDCEVSVLVAEADTLVDTSLVPFSVALASDAETSKLPGGGTAVSFAVCLAHCSQYARAATSVPVWGTLTLDAIFEAPNPPHFTISTIFERSAAEFYSHKTNPFIFEVANDVRRAQERIAKKDLFSIRNGEYAKCT